MKKRTAIRSAELRNLQDRADARNVRTQMLDAARAERERHPAGTVFMVPNPPGPNPWRELRPKRRRG